MTRLAATTVEGMQKVGSTFDTDDDREVSKARRQNIRRVASEGETAAEDLSQHRVSAMVLGQQESTLVSESGAIVQPMLSNRCRSSALHATLWSAVICRGLAPVSTYARESPKFVQVTNRPLCLPAPPPISISHELYFKPRTEKNGTKQNRTVGIVRTRPDLKQSELLSVRQESID
jgi:hypothetical protein